MQHPDPLPGPNSVTFSIVLPGTVSSPVLSPPASSASLSGSVDSESASVPVGSSSGFHSLVSVPPSPVDDPADIAPPRYNDRLRRPPDRFAFSTVHSYTPLFQTFLAAIHSHQEPRSYHEAVQHTHWQQAKSEEFRALQRMHTWDLVTLPSGFTPVGCRWV